MRRVIFASLFMPICIAQLTACENLSKTQQGAAAGAVLGGVIGAAIGNRDTAVKGAIAGAIVGAIVGNYQDRQVASRSEAARKYANDAREDRIEIESASTSPSVVAAGTAFEASIQYSVLGTNAAQSFKLTETRTLIGDSDNYQLPGRQTIRPQGTHTSSVRITLPRDIARGAYSLVTTISDGKLEKTVRTPLRIV